MTLDASKPEDQAPVSALPSYIREGRVAVNAVSGSGNVGATVLEVGIGATSLAIPADLGLYGFESVIITAAGMVTLATLTGGTAGQVKLFIFLDALIDITDGVVGTTGTFVLNQAPAGTDYSPTQYSTLTLINVGGDGGATSHGYWKEVDRAANV